MRSCSKVILAVITCLLIVLILHWNYSENSAAQMINARINKFVDSEKIDWQDFEFLKYELTRTGPGENGRGYKLTDPKEIEENERLSKIEGYSVLVSDKISVTRSLPDPRHQKLSHNL